MHPVKLLENTAGRAAHVARHPIASAAYAAGVVRGLAGLGARVVTGRAEQPERVGARGEHRASTPVHDQRPAATVELDPVPAPEPTPLHESFATEPTATSRDSAHGRSGADADIDAWAEDAADIEDADIEDGDIEDDGDIETPGTEPLIDPGAAKAIRKEAETLQKAADPDKG